MSSTEIDEDGEPVWSCQEGSELPGRHLALERLGLGHRYETWLVWSVRLWCPAVLKLPRPHEVERLSTREALEREVRALSGIVHPGLPRLIDDGTAESLPYIVIEYIDGPALDECIEDDGPLQPMEAALLGVQLLSAVAALHTRGLVHLDLKPANILLSDGKPILVDFGFAYPIGSPQRKGFPSGTEGYSAPEQVACQPVSTAMDVYGVGAVLHESLTGHPPGEGGTRIPSMLEAFLDPDPGRRPDTTTAALMLARQVPPQHRPWPEWADRYLTAPETALAGPADFPKGPMLGR
ncbi:serine/threonine protein kinase [Amycolatopsis rhizosphaerae]|uniref:non-specific serine/threonine protein kinase n=1 Tax=Amycolatopsis rhizosphaerae TaxID=2053003 RepID=A0A558DAV3_9PSEU|nr:serine/threonine-protein kinase [Amycolatopsis rhizosphaerae]TVT58157.1 serine/threonine protein kinase [Amycolatopsis rhizosphaerae]